MEQVTERREDRNAERGELGMKGMQERATEAAARYLETKEGGEVIWRDGSHVAFRDGGELALASVGAVDELPPIDFGTDNEFLHDMERAVARFMAETRLEYEGPVRFDAIEIEVLSGKYGLLRHCVNRLALGL